jgi:hypothetical protein
LLAQLAPDPGGASGDDANFAGKRRRSAWPQALELSTHDGTFARALGVNLL